MKDFEKLIFEKENEILLLIDTFTKKLIIYILTEENEQKKSNYMFNLAKLENIQVKKKKIFLHIFFFFPTFFFFFLFKKFD